MWLATNASWASGSVTCRVPVLYVDQDQVCRVSDQTGTKPADVEDLPVCGLLVNCGPYMLIIIIVIADTKRYFQM